MPSFLRDCFPGYKNLDCLFFFLQHVKYMIPQHSGLTCSDETSVLILIGPLMHTMSLCSCCFEDFFPLSLGSFNIMCFCVDLDLSFLDLQSNVYFTLFHVKYFILFTMFYFTSLTGKFLTIISLSIHFSPLCFVCSFSNIHMWWCI